MTKAGAETELVESTLRTLVREGLSPTIPVLHRIIDERVD